MALGYAVGKIAGVDLKVASDDCKTLILGGSGLKLGLSGSNSRGTGGAIFTQIHSAPAVPFGVRLEYAPVSVLNSVLAAISAALLAPDSFVVDLHDDINVVFHNCTWDFDAAPAGPNYPEQRTNETYIKDVVLSLYAVSAATPIP